VRNDAPGDVPQKATAAETDVRIRRPPSLTVLAAEALRGLILGGELPPGTRVVENQLTVRLGVSRPPLREALRVLEQEGLVRAVPPRGTIVTPVSMHDVYEIFSLREELERIAVHRGVPAADPGRLARMRAAQTALDGAAGAGDRAGVTEAGFAFHLSLIGLAGHGRLEDAYRSLSLQMRLCMALNRRARSHQETLLDDAERHRRILDAAERRDADGVLNHLMHHGDLSFLDEMRHLPTSRDAEAWLVDLEARGRWSPSGTGAPD
jgi:DNA-binding GntR family transcriptional regulator